MKKPLQTKKSSTANNGTQRRRPALGDVSNVTKTDTVDIGDAKKQATGKVGLTSKAATQAGGVQKLTRTNSSRSALGIKDNNDKKPVVESKRPGSGSGVMSSTQMKRTSSQKSIKEDVLQEEQPPRKKVDIEKKSSMEKPSTKDKPSAIDKQSVKPSAIEKPSATDKPSTMPKEAASEPEIIRRTPHNTVLDLDTQDLDDPLMAAEYVVEIFEYLRHLEIETLPNPDYIEHQPDLEWKMRGILVDWLIEVHTRFRLLPETLFLAVNIIDRFLSAEVVALDRLQLVGITAMFIASKYEELLSPHVANFSHVADNTFSDKEILDAERHVLATLDYNMSYPNPMHFLRRISKADNYDIETRTLGKYLMEISLLDHRFMEYSQSHVAAAAMYLARLILERGSWASLIAPIQQYLQANILIERHTRALFWIHSGGNRHSFSTYD